MIIRLWLGPLLLIWLALGGPAPAWAAQAGIDWTLQATPQDLGWNTVTYGAGKFVALPWSNSGAGGVMTSPNGRDWSFGSIPSSPGGKWTSVIYANGKFVTVMQPGGGFVGLAMTSPDGITWTEQATPQASAPLPAYSWSSVAYGGGQFVAVSQTSGGVMTSPDGIDWTLRTAPNCPWRSVTYGNGAFVAVASKTSINATCGGQLVMTSSDGITWTPRNSALDTQWISMTYGNGKFVAVAQYYSSVAPGYPGAVMTSDDNGVTWTLPTVPNCGWKSVTYGGGLFVAVSVTDGPSPTFECRDKRVMTSPDGVTWTARNTPANNQWTAVTYGNGLFAAVAASGTGNRAMTSGNVCGDGITLTTSPTPLWQQLALPCVPSASPPSVANSHEAGPTPDHERHYRGAAAQGPRS